MALEDRIVALAQAIGADVASLEDAVSALEGAVVDLLSRPRITVSSSAPESPEEDDIWIEV